MSNPHLAVKGAPTAVPVVPIVKRTVFAFKTRPAIPEKGLNKGVYVEAVNESGSERGNAFNRIHTLLDVTDAKGTRHQITKDYDILPKKRGISAFVQDYNKWSGAGLTEEDLYNEFDMQAMVIGKEIVVDIDHRKVGKKWEAFIKDFYPVGTIEAVAEAKAKEQAATQP